jgi:hypothetical protein
MADHLSENDTLIQDIMRHSEDAARFHGSMAGHAEFPESFIRDWVAINLYQPHKIGVTVESGRKDVRKYLVDEKQAGDHDAHNLLRLRNYRLDMIVWEELASGAQAALSILQGQPISSRPRIIVEFKRSLLIEDDLARTSAILSIAHRAGLDGYIVLCLMSDKKEKFAAYKAQLDRIPADKRDGDILMREPAQAPNGLGTTWCGVFAIKAKPPLA